MSTTVDKPTVERQAVSMLRRWCPIAETHQDADDPNCGWDHDWTYYTYSHRLRLRRMLVCSIKGCEQGYFTEKEFLSHVCFSAY